MALGQPYDGGYWPDESDPLAQVPGYEKFHRLARKHSAMILIALRLSGYDAEADLLEASMVNKHSAPLVDVAKTSAAFEFSEVIRAAGKWVNKSNPRPEVKEKADLDAKIAPLLEFMKTTECFDLSMDERSRLMRQSVLMREYSQVLGERIAAF